MWVSLRFTTTGSCGLFQVILLLTLPLFPVTLHAVLLPRVSTPAVPPVQEPQELNAESIMCGLCWPDHDVGQLSHLFSVLCSTANWIRFSHCSCYLKLLCLFVKIQLQEQPQWADSLRMTPNSWRMTPSITASCIGCWPGFAQMSTRRNALGEKTSI